MNVENKLRFMKLVGELEDTVDGISNLTKWLVSNKSDWFSAPASTKFHGCYEGGLVEHSLCVYDCLCKICDTFDTEHKISRKSILLVSLFHDLCKCNVYHPIVKYRKDSNGQWESYNSYEFKDSFPVGHGEKSVIMLQYFVKLTTEEILSIRYHMGPYDEKNLIGLSEAQEKYPLVVYLHLADMLASKIYKC